MRSNPPKPDRSGRTAIWITGATEGIGLGLSRNCPYPDARIVNLSRRPHPLLESRFLDLGDQHSLDDMAGYFLDQLSGFTGQRAIFIQNAHLKGLTGFAGEVAADRAARDIAANVAAPLFLGDAFLRAVLASGFAGEAGIVMLSSAAARSPYEGQSIYCAGKAAIEMWVRVVRREAMRRKRANLWVTAVRPGFVDTGLTRAVASLPAQDYPVAPDLKAAMDDGRQLLDIDTAARQIWAALPAHQSLLLFGEQVQAGDNA